MTDNKPPIKTKKYERIYKTEDSISIWRYDASKSTTGPYEVEIKSKKKQS